MKQLIEAEPTSISEIKGGGYLIQFGEMEIWQRFGAVILTEATPRYARFMVKLGETGLPEFEAESERKLTQEEIEHFAKMAKEAERATKKAQHQQQRRKLAQHQQPSELAKPAVINGRIPI